VARAAIRRLWAESRGDAPDESDDATDDNIPDPGE
jgi:hypothetical protein